jgi:predicted kinase
MLVVLSGLPGVGKTTVARELARRSSAVHLRIDSIEQVIRSLYGEEYPLADLGYRIAYAVAEDNLRLGLTVIADSVNPIPLTRDAWIEVARCAAVDAIEIEILCSDSAEHKRRVEMRTSDIPGLRMPTWNDILLREYEPWNRKHIVLDTAHRTLEQNVELIQNAMRCTSSSAR